MPRFLKTPQTVDAYKVGSDSHVPEWIQSVTPLSDRSYEVDVGIWAGPVAVGDYIVCERIPDAFEEPIIYTLEWDVFESVFEPVDKEMPWPPS